MELQDCSRTRVCLDLRKGGLWDWKPVWIRFLLWEEAYLLRWAVSTGFQTLGLWLPHTSRLPVRSWAAPRSFNSKYTVTWRAEPVTGASTKTPWGMELTQRWYCFQKGKEVAERTTRVLYPFPPSGLHHSCHLFFQAHLPFLPEAASGLKAGPICVVKTRAFPGEWWRHRTGVPESGGVR